MLHWERQDSAYIPPTDTAVSKVNFPRDWPNRTVSRIVSAASTRWHVQQTGQGMDVLLIHGTGSSTHTWETLLPGLAKTYHVTAFDLPGHGFSENLSGNAMDLHSIAAGVAALKDSLDLHPRVYRCPLGRHGHCAAIIACVRR